MDITTSVIKNESYKLKIEVRPNENETFIKNIPDIQFNTKDEYEGSQIFVESLNRLYKEHQDQLNNIEAISVSVELIVIPLHGKLIYYFESTIDESYYLDNDPLIHTNINIVSSDVNTKSILEEAGYWGCDTWGSSINIEFNYKKNKQSFVIHNIEAKYYNT